MLHRISRLTAAFAVLNLAVSLVPTLMQAQDRANAALVVREFSVAAKAAWPYDAKQLQSQTIAELTSKLGSQADILAAPPATAPARLYTLEGEIVSWRSGNAAKRLLVGMGSGRESADIHYWLTNAQGKKVFEHKDTIRAEFWGNAYSGSVGQLSHPFASKIASRLADAKVLPGEN
jgi:Domain of unknown function (DUF4410)